MVKPFILIVLLFCETSFSKTIISEVFANPSFLEDSQSEFIELVNLSSSSLDINLLYRNNTLSALNLKPGVPVLICRDSVALNSVGIACFLNWNDLILTNSDSLRFSIQTILDTLNFTVPPAKSGVSWENHYQNLINESQWKLATTASDILKGDLASPFILPFDSLFMFNRDLKIDSIYTFETKSTIQFHIFIKNIGKQLLPNFHIKTVLYRNGLLENGFELDSSLIDRSISSLQKEKIILEFQKIQQGLFHFELSEDDFTLNNIKTIFFSKPSPIIISEVCPNPTEGDAEWFEITNSGNETFSLRFIHYNLKPLSSLISIEPQQSIIVTNNKDMFNLKFGSLNLTVIEPPTWNILSNDGDSVIIYFKHTLSEFTLLDSMFYPKITTTQKNNCWIKDSNGKWTPVSNQINSTSSPGFLPPVSKQLTWNLNSKIIRKNQNLEVEIETNLGKTVDVKIFDLKGRVVESLCSLCTGSLNLTWNGTKQSSFLPMGPYILWIQEQGKKPIKTILILTQ